MLWLRSMAPYLMFPSYLTCFVGVEMRRDAEICLTLDSVWVRYSTVEEAWQQPLFCILQMDIVLFLELKSTRRCAILFGPQSRVCIIPVALREVMCTRMPHAFRDATLRVSRPTATSNNVSNTSTKPEKFFKLETLASFYKSGYSDRPRSSSGNTVYWLMHQGLAFDPQVYAAFRRAYAATRMNFFPIAGLQRRTLISLIYNPASVLLIIDRFSVMVGTFHSQGSTMFCSLRFIMLIMLEV
jgi:hypothetical protein